MDLIERTIAALKNHPFRPVKNGMTVEPVSGKDGVEDFTNDDWRRRTLALRDFVRAGGTASDALVTALADESAEVRYLAAAALGVLEADSALDGLHELLTSAAECTVRSQAAISVGQIASSRSEAVLEAALASEDHRDVAPQ
ncbi:MAG TPA: HEAT repeat domain-containing protein, partial [Spirochaetia bacterium]|nr:HEAT repeat domain-containing protein [Spirochaetia bacterium]